MAEGAVVVDTSLLLYLGRIGHLELLPSLFSKVYVPEQVVLELDVGRMPRIDTVNPGALSWTTIESVSAIEMNSLPPNQLGAGEQSVIAHAKSHPDAATGLDDRQARRLAAEIGLTVVGTIGVLIRAKHHGLIASVGNLLGACRKGCRSFGTTPQMGCESRTNVDFHARSICWNPIESTVSSSRRDTSH